MNGQNIDSLVVQITESNQGGNQWNYQIQVTDSFHSGIKQSTVYQSWSLYHWINSSWTSYTFDAFGNLTNRTYRTWDSTGWKNNNRDINSYNAGNLLLTELNQTWNGSVWVNNTQILHNYNLNNKDTLILTQSWRNSSWRNSNENERTFDVNGILAIEKFSNFDTTALAWKPYMRYLYSGGEVITQYGNDTAWSDYYKVVSMYGLYGIMSYDTYRPSGIPGEWDHENAVIYSYDSLGHYIGFENNCQGACGYSYGNLSYDSLGRLQIVFNHSESMGGNTSESKQHYYYLDFPNSSSLYVLLPLDFERCSADATPIGAFTLGGIGSLKYRWTPSAGLNSDTILNPLSIADSTINYLIEVTDSAGNTVSNNITITVNASPEPSIFIQSIDTATLCNSAILATDSISWLSCRWYRDDTLQVNPYGFSAAHFPILQNGNYIVTVQNIAGCSNTDTLKFSFFSHPSPTVSLTSHCNQLFAHCPTAVNFQWFNNGVLIFGATNDTLNVTANGDYKVMIQDQNGCVNYSNQQVFHPMNVNFYKASTCGGTCQGWLSGNANFGTPPYQYQWSNGETTIAIDSLCHGNYTITLTDSRGCVVSKTDSITNYQDFPAYNIVASTVTDSNSCNGAAFVNFPSPAYYSYFNYLWSDSSTNYMTNVCAGWNYVKITSNFHSCVELDSFFVSINPSNINCQSNLNLNNPHCVGVCDGYIEANPTGAAPFNYVWLQPNYNFGQSVSNLCTGNYSMFVIDGNGCIDSGIVTMVAQDTIVASFSILSASPSSPCSTLVNANVSNGVSPYSFDWCGVSNQNPAYLCPGNCILTVQDITGCSSQFTFDVPDSAVACSYTSSVQLVSASGVCDGSISLTILGVAPFAYTWTTGATDSTITNLCEGTYFFAATDSNGCVVTDSVVIGINHTVNIPNDIKMNNMFVYPNPGFNDLHIVIPENIKNEKYLLKIYNSQGQLIYETTSIERIPVALWSSGLFEFILQSERGVLKTRWIKN